MKTTIEIPDTTFRQVKTYAASKGMSMKQFFTEALEEQLRRSTECSAVASRERPWMAGFGALADLSQENRRVLNSIDDEFENLDPEDLA